MSEFAVCDHCAKLGRCQLGIAAIFQLPKRGAKCPHTRKSRSWWEDRIYPNLRNKGKPSIQVPRQQQSGSKSTPMIPGAVICAYLRSLGDDSNQK